MIEVCLVNFRYSRAGFLPPICMRNEIMHTSELVMICAARELALGSLEYDD